MTGAALYILLGRIFSDRVMSLYGVVGDLTWAVVGLAATLILGYQLLVGLRRLKPDAAGAQPKMKS